MAPHLKKKKKAMSKTMTTRKAISLHDLNTSSQTFAVAFVQESLPVAAVVNGPKQVVIHHLRLWKERKVLVTSSAYMRKSDGVASVPAVSSVIHFQKQWTNLLESENMSEILSSLQNMVSYGFLLLNKCCTNYLIRS